jgi:ribosomal protein L11 methyltransferase
VQAEDADADSPEEQPLYGEPGMAATQAGWVRTRLAAMLGEDAQPQAILAEAAAALGAAMPAGFEVREIPDQDWVSASQAQFEPIPIGERLLITPSWHLDTAPAAPGGAGGAGRTDGANRADGMQTIVLDPGLAFGTGSHPTTRMCLEWLASELRPGQTVIDYGCGSGILAIAAARLGASSVVALDIDPQAVRSTQANARVNGVTLDARVTTEAPPQPADIVLANILARPLKVLAPMLASLVRPGGSLVLAGLLDRQADDVAAAYPGVDLTVCAVLDGWACLAGRKR